MNCDLVTQLSLSNLNLKSAIFQICYIVAKSKSDNYKPISIPKHTLWDPCVTQLEMQLFDPIITFKYWFKVCHIFHYIVIQGKVI